MVDSLINTFVKKLCEFVFHGSGFLICALPIFAAVMQPAAAQNTVVIRDVTVIDGTGDPAQPAMTVVIDAGKIVRIESVGNADEPSGADVIDGAGKFLLPGFIDSNVHASIYGNSTRRETVVKYGERNDELALEFVQRQLMHGVTTVRDSYGALEPLMEVRDRIERGEAIGSRMLVAGNIVGWGGPFSMTFSLMAESDLTLFQAQWNDHIAQGVGEELMDMGPEEVRVAINQYLDKGPDFIKYGGTSHFSTPSLIGFSPRVQKAIVDETHKRGLIAETHSTSPEALRMSVEAGIDLIQHPEILSREYPEDLLQLIVERDVLCALRSNTLGGSTWQDHLARKKENEASLQGAAPPKTSAERRQRENLLNLSYEIQRRNAERLIRAGCRVTIATDNYQGRAPEFRKETKPDNHDAGIGSVIAIEGLVELGMTEMEAIVAATRNGAIAAGMLDSIGTIEVGKEADLVLLRADPLTDISNIRRIENVIARGKIVNLEGLPEKRIFYLGPGWVPEVAVAGRAGEAAAVVAVEDSVSSVSKTSEAESTGQSGSDEDVFGDNLPVASVSQSSLGNLIIILDNGQQWRQLDSDNTRVKLPADRTGLTADIRRAFLGSVSMSLGESKRSIKVSRIN
ncbi:MAG: imidazolonepropionase-like amidohydrolase [Woeseiaceae bacterium]